MTGVTNTSSIGTVAPLGDSSASPDGSSAISNADGSLTVTSAGGDVVATHSDPLPVVAIPVAVMPEAVEVAIVAPTKPEIWSSDIASAGDWTAQKVELGRAIIDIDSIYRLSINDILAEVLLENRETNVVTRIWGDAQVSVNGHDVGQFWGTSSFELANGTLITANTIVSPDNASAYMLDKLIVTRDEYGFVVTGISTETVGDLDIALAANVTVYDHVHSAPAASPVAAPVTETAAAPVAAVESVTEAPVAPASSEALPVSAGKEAQQSKQTVEAVTVEAVTVEAVTVAEAPVAEAPAATPAEKTPAAAPAPAPMLVENKEAVIAAIKAKVDGYDMDDDHRDGLVFVETATGWIDEWDDQAISAAVLTQTMPGELFGPNSDIMSRSEFTSVINRFISIMTTQSFMSNISMRNSEFQSQLRDRSADQDRASAAKQAEQRAARERVALMGLMEAGSIAAELIDRYRGVERSAAQAA